MTTTNERTFPNLRRFNLFMGLFHLAQGVLMLALSDLDFKLPVTTAFLKYDETTEKIGLQFENGFRSATGPAGGGVSFHVRPGTLSDLHAGNL
jgi:hypothetical protein